MAGKDLFAPASEAKAKGKDLFAGSQPASPFLQRGMKMVAGAQAPAPNQNILPGMGGGNMGTPTARPAYMGNAGVIERQRLADMARNAAQGAQDARLAPVKEAGKTAAGAAMSDFSAGFETPKPNLLQSWLASGPQEMGVNRPVESAGIAAEREVFDRAGVMMPDVAGGSRLANAAALGLPAILNKDFRATVAQAGEDQPGMAMFGDAAGSSLPIMKAWDVTGKAVNALARPFIPRGADAASRTVRYGAPLTGQVAGAGLTNATVQAGIYEPIRAEQAGEELTLGGMAEAAKSGFTDPLNLLPLGFSAINRGYNQLTTGIATGANRAAEMANRYGVGPRQTAASQGIAQTTQALGGQLQGADIRGLTNIENALRFALRDNRNIPDVNARIATGFQRIRESLPLEDDPTLNLARLIEREFAPDAPQTRDILRNFLRGVGLNSPGGGQIVGDAANQMRGQQADVLRTELESSFGAQPKTEANAAMQQSLDQFSQAYNTVLGSAPRQGPQVDRARALLAREPQSAAILDDIAQSQNLTAEQFIERNPLQALHEVQSELATQARALAARGDAGAGPLEITVRNMQRPLRDAVPGYGDLQGLWRQWTQARERMGYVRGAESGTRGELSTVPGFGDKIFGPGGIAKSEMGTQTAADLYLQMDDLSQRSAGLSVRDVINDELRKGKAAGLEERYQTAANMRRVATEGGLDALRRVFGEAGDRVARRIEQFMDANEFARNIDPEFNSATINKGQAMATGAQPFAGPMGQAADSASSALSQSAITDAALMLGGASTAPIVTAMRGLPVIGQMFRPGQRSQRNIAETLLRRGEIGSQVPPRPGGPAPITPIDPAMVPGARPPPGGPPPGSLPPTGGAPPQAPAPLTTGAPAMAAPVGAPVPPPPPIRASGFTGLRTDAGNAAIGAGVGALGPADSNEERLRNMAGGALLLGAGGRLSRTAGARNALADTASAGMGKPRTPQQAARFETPGSPEYEAAVAKGLDMSQAGRMARAKEMGFDTDTVLYHGTEEGGFDAFAGPTFFARTKGEAGMYAADKSDMIYKWKGARTAETFDPKTVRDGMSFDDSSEWEPGNWYAVGNGVFRKNANNKLEMSTANAVDIDWSKGEFTSRPWNKKKQPQVIEVFPRANLNLKRLSAADASRLARDSRGNIGPGNMDETAIAALKSEGFDGVVANSDFGAGEIVVVFDPSNIRSVNAAFDPDKAASPILTAGFGARAPVPPPKPPGKLGTRVADGAAIAAVASAPTEEADTSKLTPEMVTANKRVALAEQTVADTRADIKKLESQLEMLQDPAGDPAEKQRILKLRGHDLGKYGPKKDGIDGVIDSKTIAAINGEAAKIEAGIARKQADLEKAQAEEAAGRKDVTREQMRQSLADAEKGIGSPMFKTAADLTSGAAFLGGIYLAGRARGGAVKEYAKSARTAATNANRLLNSGRYRADATVGPNSANVRAANLNEFWKQGGAGRKVPFTSDDLGQLSARKGAKEPSQLFKAPRYLDNDKKFIIATAIESQATKAAADHFGKEAEEAQKEMDAAYAANDRVAYDAAVKARNLAAGGETFFRVLERLGYGLAAGRTLSGLKKYPAVNANIKAAEAERNLILQGLQKQKTVGAKP